MYYLVGSYKDKNFIYDTEDSSCRCMLDIEDLTISSGWNPISYAKLMLACRIPSFNYYANIPLISYRIVTKYKSNSVDLYKTYDIEFGIYIIDWKYIASYCSGVKSFYKRWNYQTKFGVFLGFVCPDYWGLGIFERLWCREKSGVDSNNDICLGWGAPIPPDQLPYLLKLHDSMDFIGFKNALKGFNIDDIYTSDEDFVECKEISWINEDWSCD